MGEQSHSEPTFGFGGEYDTADDIEHDPLHPHPEVPTPIRLVMKLTQPQREERVTRLVTMAHDRYAEALRAGAAGRNVAATCLLLSGGNDSYTVGSMFRDQATHVVHANTGTGIEATREHVRSTAALWGLPLIEVHPKAGQGYDDLVRGLVHARSRTTGEFVQSWPGGFPGPAAHQVMFTRLKERGLETVAHRLGISGSRTDVAVFIAGRRRAESFTRRNIPHFERRGTTLWSSPIAVWHKADLRAYRLMSGDVPVNPVALKLGMSGECGCLANAKPGEADRWRDAYPDDPFIARMDALEAEIADRPDIEARWKKWGNASLLPTEERSPEGLLCGKDCGHDPLLDVMDPLFQMEGYL